MVVVEGTVDVCREHMAMLHHHTNLSHSEWGGTVQGQCVG